MTAVCISVLLWPPFQHTSPENLNLIEMLEILLRVMIAYHHHHVLLSSVSVSTTPPEETVAFICVHFGFLHAPNT